MKTANNKRQRLEQTLIPEEVKYTTSRATLDTASRKVMANENVEGMYQYLVFFDEEWTTSTNSVTYHVLWYVRQNG